MTFYVAIFNTLVKYGLIMCFSYITLVEMAFIGLLKALWRNIESTVGRKTLVKHSPPWPQSVVLPHWHMRLKSPACVVKVQTVKVGLWVRSSTVVSIEGLQCRAGFPGQAELLLTSRKTCQEEGSPLVTSLLNINRPLGRCGPLRKLPSHSTGMNLTLN